MTTRKKKKDSRPKMAAIKGGREKSGPAPGVTVSAGDINRQAIRGVLAAAFDPTLGPIRPDEVNPEVVRDVLRSSVSKPTKREAERIEDQLETERRRRARDRDDRGRTGD